MNLAVLSVIFPANLPYFNDYITSIYRQSFKDFTLILGNDGCVEEHLHLILKNYNLKYKIVNLQDMTPIKNRIFLMNHILSIGIDYIVFGDTDDFFSDDRLESIYYEFVVNKADIVVNDLMRISEKGEIISNTYWVKRLSQTSLDYKTLLKYNFLGLGNTAVKTTLLKRNFSFSEKVSTFDWMFFMQLLFPLKVNICCSKAKTYYRQHSDNTLGLNNFYTKKSLLKSIDIKAKFLEFCISICITEAEIELDKLLTLRKFLEEKAFYNKYIFKLNQNEKLFWFEETAI